MDMRTHILALAAQLPTGLRVLPAVLALAMTVNPLAAATLYTGATLYPVSAAPIEHGQMLVDGGKIIAIGAGVAQAADAERVDPSGRWVVPAFITANTVMGLVEIETVRGSVDMAEAGTVNANARAEVAVNADSELLPVARANGVLYAHVVPQAGPTGVIAGTSALIKLQGWTWEDMTVQSAVGVQLMWPSTRLPPWLPAPMREGGAQGRRHRAGRHRSGFRRRRGLSQGARRGHAGRHRRTLGSHAAGAGGAHAVVYSCG